MDRRAVAARQPRSYRGGLGTGVVCVALLLPFVPAAGAVAQERDTPRASEQRPDARREAAVGIARDGRLEEAKNRLIALAGERPDDMLAVGDLLVVLGWIGDHEEIVLRTAGLTPDMVPGYAVAAVARAASALGDPLTALVWYAHVPADAPESDEAFRGRALALSALGAAHPASEQVRARPDLFTLAEREQIEGDRAAALVRWITLPAVDDAAWSRRLDATLAALDDRVAVVPATLEYHALRARFDRIVALAARGDAASVVAEVEELERLGVELQAYVLRVAGEAYLQLRRPRRAAEYLRRDLAQRPGHVDSRISLFYALLEQEDFRGALAQADSLVAEQPAWRWGPGLREPRENADRVRAEVIALMGRAFAGRLAEAERGLRALSDQAPANVTVRSELASVYRFRGWPTRALEQAELGLALDSASLMLRVARAAALHDRRDWPAARSAIAELGGRHAENSHVRRLAREAELQRGWTFAAGAEAGSGSGAAVATRDSEYTAGLLTPRSDAGVRGFVRGRRAEARFEPGTAVYERVAGGVHVDRRSGWAELAAGSTPRGDDPGIDATVGIRAGDRFTASLAYESNSARVPLQARVAGVDGWSAAAAVRMAWHEGRTAALDVARVALDDTNDRVSAYGSLEQRMITTPHLRVGGLLELYASRNSMTGASYFNPAHDFSPALGLVTEWLTWRRYEQSFTQHLTLSGGGYWQDGYDVEPSAVIRYQHLWSATTGMALRYGVTYASRAFDGRRENRTSFTTSLEWRVR